MNRKKEYPGFLLYFDRVEGLFNNLNDVQLGYIFRAMYQYARYGTDPEDMPMIYALVWPTLKAMLDADRNSYEEKCAQGAHAAACRIAEAQGKDKPDKESFFKEYRIINSVRPKTQEQEFEELRKMKLEMLRDR